MPSRDPKTGKRLSGSAQAKLTAARRQGLDHIPTPCLTNVPLPPAGVGAIESWAAVINLRCAVETVDPVRLHWIGTLCRELGKMAAKARRAEKVMKLRRLRQGIDDHIDLDAPPIDDPVAIVPWCYAAVAAYLHTVASAPGWGPDEQKALRLKSLCQAGFLACPDDLQKVIDEIEAEG